MKQDNLLSMELHHFGRWLMTLDNVESFIFRQGSVGSAFSRRVCLDKYDIENIGGNEKLKEVLESIETKALSLKGYAESYKDITKIVSRVRNKFLKTK